MNTRVKLFLLAAEIGGNSKARKAVNLVRNLSKGIRIESRPTRRLEQKETVGSSLRGADISAYFRSIWDWLYCLLGVCVYESLAETKHQSQRQQYYQESKDSVPQLLGTRQI